MEVFRNFNEMCFAESLATAGTIKLGTLNSFRECEQARRGDSREGSKIFRSGTFSGDSSDPAMALVMKRFGWGGSGFGKGTISNCSRYEHTPDAFVLCTSTRPITDEEELETFGRHRVRISDVDLFAHRVSKSLFKEFGCEFFHQRGPVRYGHRTYQGLEEDPGNAAFLKDPEFSGQHEYRFLWRGDRRFVHEPVVLSVRKLASLCSVEDDS